VHVQGNRSVATDGKMLAVAEWPNGQCEGEFAVPAKTAKTLASSKAEQITVATHPSDVDLLHIECVGRGATTVIETHQCEGRFPAYRNIIPKGVQYLSVRLDADMLANLITALAAPIRDNLGEAELVLSVPVNDTNRSPLMLSGATPDGNRTFGLIMPIANASQSLGTPEQPAWIPE
jgi:hypothetical protein